MTTMPPPSRDESTELAVSSPPAASAATKHRDSPAAPEHGTESPSMDKERQIPVDPVSLRHLGMVADEDSPLSAPSVLTQLVVQSPLLPPLRRPTFVGASLPCSAASSPVHSASAKLKRDESTAAAASSSPSAALRALARQHSVALAHYAASPAAVAAAPSALSRSASRAEGRSMVPHDETVVVETKAAAAREEADESFNCGALCMYIPGFTKKKPAAAAAAVMRMSSLRRQQSGARRRSSVSRLASLERFECGSWSPPPQPQPQTAPATTTEITRDFAVEMMAKISGADDTEAPVKMAFVFDSDPEPRGILKKSASSRQEPTRPSTSSSSQRHVRFSTAAAAASCPTSPCVTPRLARARAEFNAFLEAQSA